MMQIEGKRVSQLVEEGVVRHHWIIESPNGATSKGVCRLHRGEEKRFPNYNEESQLESLGRWKSRRVIKDAVR